MAMNAKLKSDWIAALRSGKYHQAAEFLEEIHKTGRVKGNCCLGVLCRIAGEKRERNFDDITFGRSSGNLDKDQLKKLGLTYRQQKELINMNDDTDGSGKHVHKFPEIADWIEKKIKVSKRK